MIIVKLIVKPIQMSKPKKKLKDTAVGKFLLGAGTGIIDNLGDVLPDKGVMGLVKNLINIICSSTDQENYCSYCHCCHTHIRVFLNS